MFDPPAPRFSHEEDEAIGRREESQHKVTLDRSGAITDFQALGEGRASSWDLKGGEAEPQGDGTEAATLGVCVAGAGFSAMETELAPR